MTDDELFETIYETINFYANNKIGDTLTEYDWRGFSELCYLINKRNSPQVQERNQKMIEWNKAHEEKYEREVKERQQAGNAGWSLDLDFDLI